MAKYWGIFVLDDVCGWLQEEGHTNRRDAAAAYDWLTGDGFKVKVRMYDGTPEGLQAVTEQLNGRA